MKITTLSALIKLGYTRVDKNKANIGSDSNINSDKIDNKIVNLSSSISKKDELRNEFFYF